MRKTTNVCTCDPISLVPGKFVEPNNYGGHYKQLFRTNLWSPVLLVFVLSVVSGCQSFQYQTLLDQQVLEGEIIQSDPFQHRIFRKVELNATNPSALHIYIEGDGQPWRTRYFIASDPTPKSPLMLQAMLRDSANSLYLTRPCYYHTQDPACSAMDWTMARYGELVVSSMTNIVDKLGADIPDLWLIGHSGGGALAVLIGQRLQRPVKVVTIAANIDHQAWTEYHDYTPLQESLNPATDTARNPLMREIHWYGSDDKNVLPQWIQAYCRDRAVECRETHASHAGGWLPLWQQVLSESQASFEVEH